MIYQHFINDKTQTREPSRPIINLAEQSDEFSNEPSNHEDVDIIQDPTVFQNNFMKIESNTSQKDDNQDNKEPEIDDEFGNY